MPFRPLSIALGALLLAFGTPMAGLASSSGLEEADRLYFHRNEAASLEKSIALLEERPDDPEALWRLCRSLVSLGGRAGKGREKTRIFSRAEAAADRAIEKDPRSAQAYYWKGMALGLKGRARGMFRSMATVGPLKRLMRKVIELDPGHAGAHHFLGEMLRRIPAVAGGSKKEAVRELENSVALAPGRVDAYVALARAYLDTGNVQGARRALMNTLEVRTPDDPAAFEENLADARRLLEELGGPIR